MSDLPMDTAATDEAGSTPLGDVGQSEGRKQGSRRFLAPSRRDLSEEELSSPAARRFLIAEIERLDDECTKFDHFREQHAQLSIENAKLKESLKKSRWIDVLSFVSSSVGAAGLGAGASYLPIPDAHGVGIVVIVGSSILVLLGAIAKVFS